jgi:hypothetical protein
MTGVWGQLTYDPELDLVYYGSSGVGPASEAQRKMPGATKSGNGFSPGAIAHPVACVLPLPLPGKCRAAEKPGGYVNTTVRLDPVSNRPLSAIVRRLHATSQCP